MNLFEQAKQAGFQAEYLLPVPQYDEWTRRRASGAFAPQTDWIEGDAPAAYPWANGLLLLIWPYAPLIPDAVLSGYYPASNQSYHAMRSLRERLAGEGVRTERAAVPVKTILVNWGLGTRLDSDLIYIPGFGTRFIVQALMVSLSDDELCYTPRQAPFEACVHCKRCERACPGGAIKGRAYDWRQCLRAYEEGPDMPEWVMEKLTCLLGCEVCQADRRRPETSPFDHRQEYEEGRQADGPGRGAGGQPKAGGSAAVAGTAGPTDGGPPEGYPDLGNFPLEKRELTGYNTICVPDGEVAVPCTRNPL